MQRGVCVLAWLHLCSCAPIDTLPAPRRVEWTEKQTLQANYEKTGLLLDANHGFGRNKKSDPLKSKEQRLAEDGETFSDDDGEVAY